ncbi:hypothetical protein G3O07_03190 [Pseudomonas laurentiana]|uniref:Uncharacterized protein n=1 Tax=Pseudomonas laurentiana TaxID=2364649 RepID=A0A6I5RLF8_9PSED|nr:hypothetical protein [Pseudomonas laurentiana]
MDYLTQSYAERQAQLEAAKAAFFASGGRAVKLAGFTYKPLPFRRHPEPAQKIPKGVQHAPGNSVQKSVQP